MTHKTFYWTDFCDAEIHSTPQIPEQWRWRTRILSGSALFCAGVGLGVYTGMFFWLKFRDGDCSFKKIGGSLILCWLISECIFLVSYVKAKVWGETLRPGNLCSMHWMWVVFRWWPENMTRAAIDDSCWNVRDHEVLYSYNMLIYVAKELT